MYGLYIVLLIDISSGALLHLLRGRDSPTHIWSLLCIIESAHHHIALCALAYVLGVCLYVI